MDEPTKKHHRSSEFWSEYGGAVAFYGLIALVLAFVFWGNITSFISGNGWDTQIASSCKDVTSYDHNWNNDMLCTRPDGSTFYTGYDGADQAVAKYKKNTPSVQISTEDPIRVIDSPQPTVTIQNTTCRDVTSYDYNWNNDMLCTRPDGSTFYTSYAGARTAEGN